MLQVYDMNNSTIMGNGIIQFDEVGSVELLDGDTDDWCGVSGIISCSWASSPPLLSMVAGPIHWTNKCFYL